MVLAHCYIGSTCLLSFIDIFTTDKFYFSKQQTEKEEKKKKKEKSFGRWDLESLYQCLPGTSKCFAFWSSAELENQVCPNFGKKYSGIIKSKERNLPISGYTKLEQALTVPANKSSYTKPVHQPKSSESCSPFYWDPGPCSHVSWHIHAATVKGNEYSMCTWKEEYFPGRFKGHPFHT